MLVLRFFIADYQHKSLYNDLRLPLGIGNSLHRPESTVVHAYLTGTDLLEVPPEGGALNALHGNRSVSCFIC